METLALTRIEEHRLQEQGRLDALKTAPERNKWGQFATGPELALSLARYAHDLMGDTPVRFLDPAIGTGSFYSALSQAFRPMDIETAVGVELDPLFAQTAANLWGESGLVVVNGDFTQQPLPARSFNLILANPPYVRHHHLSATDKDRLQARLARSVPHVDLSGLAGLYCYFLLLCHQWMEEGGLAVWLIPSEFMDVNYGVSLRRYLTERVTLLHVHRFCPTDVQFTDALVSSAVVVFRKTPPPAGHAARFSFAGPIAQPRLDALVPIDTLSRSSKWTQFPSSMVLKNNDQTNLGEIFDIKRGLATGSNSFFLLSETEIQNWKIPRCFLKPILPSPRHLKGDIIEALPNGDPDVSPHLFLVDCQEPEERVRVHWPRFYEYLQQGRAQNIHAAYLASRRVPWYSQERRPPAPFLCNYMGRAQNGKPPFRFLWNRSQATAHNVYLLLYPKGPLRKAMEADSELAARVFVALQRTTPAQLLSEGRVYGGGLHKVEPRELAQIPATDVLDCIEHHVTIERQMPLFVA
jgi:adenine-specific DNA-methyltransferase